MSVRRLAKEQPTEFSFSPENLAWAEKQVAKYPDGKQASAIIPLLWCAQKQNAGWVSEPAMRYLAEMLDMAYIRVYEVATFYTMFNLAPLGKYHVQLCGTTPCWLRGADELKAVCEEKIGPKGTTSADGMFTWTEVECLGACCNAPMVQINDDYFEDLTKETLGAFLDDLRSGRAPKPGSATGRTSSEPFGGPSTLTDPNLYDKSAAAPVDFAGRTAPSEGGSDASG